MHVNPCGNRIFAAAGRTQYGIDQAVLLREQFVPEARPGKGVPSPMDLQRFYLPAQPDQIELFSQSANFST